jgi:endonuclease-3
MPETGEQKQDRAKKIIGILQREYPDARCSLRFGNPLELLIATILSAQCTDDRVNLVTEQLFKKYAEAKDYAQADLAELEEEIRSTGFYKNKARNIKNCCQKIVERFQGKVPYTLEELVTLDGVGRKTANVVLGNAFSIPGMVVDTHVGRISKRLGLTRESDPVKIEFALMDIIAKEHWILYSHELIAHGRKICKARGPQHQVCPLCALCPTGQTEAAIVPSPPCFR